MTRTAELLAACELSAVAEAADRPLLLAEYAAARRRAWQRLVDEHGGDPAWFEDLSLVRVALAVADGPPVERQPPTGTFCLGGRTVIGRDDDLAVLALRRPRGPVLVVMPLAAAAPLAPIVESVDRFHRDADDLAWFNAVVVEVEQTVLSLRTKGLAVYLAEALRLVGRALADG